MVAAFGIVSCGDVILYRHDTNVNEDLGCKATTFVGYEFLWRTMVERPLIDEAAGLLSYRDPFHRNSLSHLIELVSDE